MENALVDQFARVRIDEIEDEFVNISSDFGEHEIVNYDSIQDVVNFPNKFEWIIKMRIKTFLKDHLNCTFLTDLESIICFYHVIEMTFNFHKQDHFETIDRKSHKENIFHKASPIITWDDIVRAMQGINNEKPIIVGHMDVRIIDPNILQKTCKYAITIYIAKV